MAERKRRFQDKEDVFPAVRDRLQRGFASGIFGRTHVFTTSGDIPDDWQLRLVVLPPTLAARIICQALHRSDELAPFLQTVRICLTDTDMVQLFESANAEVQTSTIQ